MRIVDLLKVYKGQIDIRITDKNDDFIIVSGFADELVNNITLMSADAMDKRVKEMFSMSDILRVYM